MVAVRIRSAIGIAGLTVTALVAASACLGAELPLLPAPSGAGSLLGALAHAYQNNPQLNAQRAIVRETDEGVPQALSGYRPRFSVTGNTGISYTGETTQSPAGGPQTRLNQTFVPYSVGVTGQQTLFNGFQTANRTRSAESSVFAARETLRVMEQSVLLDAATAYMNVLRDTAILDLQRRNVEVLQEQLKQTRDRFNVGEVTRTDVAQGESRVAAAQSSFLAAQSTLVTSRANFRRIIGLEPAARLSVAMPVDRLSPRTLPAVVGQAITENPSVTAAMYGANVALLQVKIAEGALYPTITLTGNVAQNYSPNIGVNSLLTASVAAGITIPIYQGGAEYSLVRQLKETVGQRRLDLETVRDQARANAVQAFGQLEAAKAQITAAQAQVTAAEIALNGVREEARVGQRTTLDVLNAQQELVNARVALVTAQRDRVVASFSLLSASGRLSAQVLRLGVPIYDPMTHYQQVRDAWFGLRTPDGK